MVIVGSAIRFWITRLAPKCIRAIAPGNERRLRRDKNKTGAYRKGLVNLSSPSCANEHGLKEA
jgi:hypothetical protein